MNGFLQELLAALVRGYRYAISPMLPAACRFHPSCSAYALESLQTHGPWRGSWLSACRVCRCGPWHPGGLDPVPARKEQVTTQ